MDAKQRKIYQQHYSQFATVAQARQHVQDNGPMPLWNWVKEQPPQTPMAEAFRFAMYEMEEALR